MLILTFVVIIVGGIGSVRGALVIGALLVGLVDTLGRAFAAHPTQTLPQPGDSRRRGRLAIFHVDLHPDGRHTGLASQGDIPGPWLGHCFLPDGRSLRP